MKETNSLEMQLRSLEPRRPSARLKQRLFGKADGRREHVNWSLPWLAPVAACGLLTAMMLTQNNDSAPGSFTQGTILVQSNLPSASERQFGSFNSNRIEWTNDSAFPSSVGSFLPGKVN